MSGGLDSRSFEELLHDTICWRQVHAIHFHRHGNGSYNDFGPVHPVTDHPGWEETSANWRGLATVRDVELMLHDVICRSGGPRCSSRGEHSRVNRENAKRLFRLARATPDQGGLW